MLKVHPFNRQEGLESANPDIAMPKDELGANTSTATIRELLGRLEEFCNGTEGPERFPWTQRFAMGYPLPSWQRGLEWDAEQKTRFIESIWSGVDIGSYLVNDLWEMEGEGEGRVSTFRENSDVLLDGQQRLTTLEEYVRSQFPVADASGALRYWRELPRLERIRFGQFHFTKATVKSWDEAKLRKAYNMRAYGGTPHKEHQRA